MAFRFRAAGGKVAIWDGHADTAPFDNPLANLSRVKFHSDLDYVRVVDVKNYTVNLPAIPGSGSGQGSGGRRGMRTASYLLGPHGQTGTPWIIGRILVNGVWVAFTGTVPVAQDPGLEDPDYYARWLSLGVDGTNIYAYEYSVQDGDAGVQQWQPRAARSFSVTVYITDVKL
jgi:hypothetical protein